MNEFDSPNYAEYVWDKKSEGKIKTCRFLMIALYIAFGAAYVTVCSVTNLFVLIAIAPLLVYIFVLCTWRFVSYDCYFELKSGVLELGTARVSRYGKKKRPKLTLHAKEALYIAPYDEGKDKAAEAARVIDLSESLTSDKRIILIADDKGIRTAVIFEGTAKIAKLLASLCPNAQNLKGQVFHG